MELPAGSVTGSRDRKGGTGQGKTVRETVRWAVDMTSGAAGLLITLLRAAGQPIVYVPGRLVNRMAGAFPGEGKTDAKDAHTIAETARLRGDLTPVAGVDPVVADLQVLTA